MERVGVWRMEAVPRSASHVGTAVRNTHGSAVRSHSNLRPLGTSAVQGAGSGQVGTEGCPWLVEVFLDNTGCARLQHSYVEGGEARGRGTGLP